MIILRYALVSSNFDQYRAESITGYLNVSEMLYTVARMKALVLVRDKTLEYKEVPDPGARGRNGLSSAWLSRASATPTSIAGSKALPTITR